MKIAGILLIALVSSFAVAKELPLKVFASLPEFSSPKISPDGSRVAAIVSHEGRELLVTKKIAYLLGDKKEKMGVISSEGKDFYFNGHEWANEDRLVVNLRRSGSIGGRRWATINRIVSVGRDGSGPEFFRMFRNRWGILRPFPGVISYLPDDKNHVLAAMNDANFSVKNWFAPEIRKINVQDGEWELYDKNKWAQHQLIADNAGNLRLGLRFDATKHNYWAEIAYREQSSASWEVFEKMDVSSVSSRFPFRFDSGNPRLILRTDSELWSHRLLNSSVSNFSIEENIRYHGGHFYLFDIDKKKYVGEYQDKDKAAVIAAVSLHFPSKEIFVTSRSQDQSVYILKIFSDVSPAKYYRFDRRSKKLAYIGGQYPEIDSSDLQPRENIVFQARDGLSIPMYVTRGRNVVGAAPTVVFPRWSAWGYSPWEYDRYVQFLANRGYTVLQPQMRGAVSFGKKHFLAGSGRWGREIQDDVIDGVQWAIQQEITDASKVCIVGQGSFGGYVAALGLAKAPDIFRCAVSINGIMNLPDYVKWWSELNFTAGSRRIADQRADLYDVSPIHLVENIVAPLLLIASQNDSVVRAKYSRDMKKKMKFHKKNVEYLELKNGEHWIANEKHEFKKFRAIEKFLKQHLD